VARSRSPTCRRRPRPSGATTPSAASRKPRMPRASRRGRSTCSSIWHQSVRRPGCRARCAGGQRHTIEKCPLELVYQPHPPAPHFDREAHADRTPASLRPKDVTSSPPKRSAPPRLHDSDAIATSGSSRSTRVAGGRHRGHSRRHQDLLDPGLLADTVLTHPPHQVVIGDTATVKPMSGTVQRCGRGSG
jgi:hypothetical protein